MPHSHQSPTHAGPSSPYPVPPPPPQAPLQVVPRKKSYHTRYEREREREIQEGVHIPPPSSFGTDGCIGVWRVGREIGKGASGEFSLSSVLLQSLLDLHFFTYIIPLPPVHSLAHLRWASLIARPGPYSPSSPNQNLRRDESNRQNRSTSRLSTHSRHGTFERSDRKTHADIGRFTGDVQELSP
jgi:hypothetical protein